MEAEIGEKHDRAIAAKITIRHLLNQVSGLSDLGFPELQLSQATTIGDSPSERLRQRVTSLSRARPVAFPGDIYFKSACFKNIDFN